MDLYSCLKAAKSWLSKFMDKVIDKKDRDNGDTCRWKGKGMVAMDKVGKVKTNGNPRGTYCRTKEEQRINI